jgi:hypothetical protein
VYGTTFKYGPICSTIYKATGSSVDYTNDVVGAKYTFTSELRDTGNYGFVLPAGSIDYGICMTSTPLISIDSSNLAVRCGGIRWTAILVAQHDVGSMQRTRCSSVGIRLVDVYVDVVVTSPEFDATMSLTFHARVGHQDLGSNRGLVMPPSACARCLCFRHSTAQAIVNLPL